MKKLLLVLGLLFLIPNLAFAQSAQRNPCFGNANGGCTSVSTINPLPVDESGFSSGIIPISASITGTTAATTATLAGTAGKTTYICGFSIRANATAAATGNASVTGTISGQLNFTQFIAALASGIGIVEPPLDKCIPASATNTAISVTSAAALTGGTVSVSAWGFQK